MALVRLPEGMRGELKEPLGPVHPDVERELLGDRVVTVGDIVTYHFLEAGVVPDVAVVDGRTERKEVGEDVIRRWREVPEGARVRNEAGTISRELVEALREALEGDDEVRIEVVGEEDLAVLPAIVLCSEGDSVVYGQPGEGMVYVGVDGDVQEEVLGLLRRMDVRDVEELLGLLGAS